MRGPEPTEGTPQALSAMPAFRFADEALREEERAAHRWQHMLRTLREWLESLPPNDPLDPPWAEFMVELSEIAQNARSDPEKYERQLKQAVLKGYMRIMFERDQRIQASGFGRAEASRIVFASPDELASAIAELDE
jgi:hypothetical protein